MRCPACNEENRDDGRFCTACGAGLPLACQSCGFEIAPDDSFCGGCGMQLGATESTHPLGERRQVTVLFADLSGYTRLSQDRDAEETHALLGQYFEVADGIIERYGGHVDKHIGDGVMAVFGAPIAHTDDSERAVRAALDIHREAGALDPPLVVHIGIASGEVVASGLGSDSHQEYTVTGESVNLASRLQGLSAPGESLISKAVHDAVGEKIIATKVDDVDIKGIERPLSIWRLSGYGRRDGAASSAPFVGRRGELRQFEGVLESCGDGGAGQTVYVRGDAGIRKTRLLHEFQEIAHRLGFTCHSGLVLDFGVGEGEDAVGSIVRSLLSLSSASTKEARAEAADRAVREGRVDEARRIHLYDLLGLPQPAELLAVFDAMDSATRVAGYRDTLLQLAERAAQHAPSVLRVEDVHWAGEGLLELVAALAGLAAANRIVLVLTSRFEGDPMGGAWRAAMRGSPLTTIDLAPLREEEARELASGYAEGQGDYAASCIRRAEGNPLFLDQLLRSAREPSDDIPASIQSVVLTRMDRLAPSDKDALQAAAVIGQRFSIGALRHVIGEPAYDCSTLVEHMLVQPMGGDFLFGHALLRDGAYASLLRSMRMEMHLKAAAWFAERDLVLHAEHLDRADNDAAAAAYVAAAGAQVAAFHHDRALQLVERGLEIAEMPGDRFELLSLRGDIVLNLDDKGASLASHEEALTTAKSEAQKCRSRVGCVAAMRDSGRSEEIFALLEAAQASAERHGLPELLSQIHYHRGNALFPLGEVAEVHREHELALRYARESGSPRHEAHALSGLGDAYYSQGQMLTASDHFSRCVELCREHGFGRIEAANLHVVGHTKLYRCEIAEAAAVAVACAEIAERVGNTRGQMISRTIQALILVDTEDGEGLRFAAEQSLALAKRIGARAWEALGTSYLGIIAYRERAHDEAAGIVAEACRIARETAPKFDAPWVLGILALVAPDGSCRAKAIEEAESILAGDCIGHNHLWFRRYAIAASLNVGAWSEAKRHAGALEAFTRPEPLPWADFFIRWGRAVADWHAGQRTATLEGELRGLSNEAQSCGLAAPLPQLERCVEAIGASSPRR